jgi:hypothetical protein
MFVFLNFPVVIFSAYLTHLIHFAVVTLTILSNEYKFCSLV